MEAALKLARQYFVEIGQPQRVRFIARRASYHGNTWARWRSAATSGAGSSCAAVDRVEHVSPTYAYRDQQPVKTRSNTANAWRASSRTRSRVWAATGDAFVAETVGGATAGCLTRRPATSSGVRRS